jgi:hypothetical protein
LPAPRPRAAAIAVCTTSTPNPYLTTGNVSSTAPGIAMCR